MRGPPWYAEAACQDADVEMFFEPTLYPKAKLVCMDCPVVQACLSHGLESEKYGIWGGTSPEQRRKIRRQLKLKEPE